MDNCVRIKKMGISDRLGVFMAPGVFRSEIGKISLMIVLLIKKQILAQNGSHTAYLKASFTSFAAIYNTLYRKWLEMYLKWHQT